jgi:exonuclease III
MNIRSLKNFFDDFIEYLSTINLSFSVIALSETWLNDSFSDSFHIPGYNFVAKSRKHRIGGGVGIFIKSSFTYKFRPDLELASNELTESIFLEITQSEKT